MFKTFKTSFFSFTTFIFLCNHSTFSNDNPIQYSVGLGYEKNNYSLGPKKVNFFTNTNHESHSPVLLGHIEFQPENDHIRAMTKAALSAASASVSGRVVDYSIGESGYGGKLEGSKRAVFPKDAGNFSYYAVTLGKSLEDLFFDSDTKLLVGPSLIQQSHKKVLHTKSTAVGISGSLSKKTLDGFFEVHALLGTNVSTKSTRKQTTQVGNWNDKFTKSFSGGGVVVLDSQYKRNIDARGISDIALKGSVEVYKQNFADTGSNGVERVGVKNSTITLGIVGTIK